MKSGLFTNCFKDKSWEEVCIFAKEAKITCLEVGAGGLHGTSHCDPRQLVKEDNGPRDFLKTAEKHGIEIGSFSCMGNPLHPNKKIADGYAGDLLAVIELASKIGVKVVNSFAGVPGAAPDGLYPSWIGLPYPPEYTGYVKWQWEDKIIPFWKDMSVKLKKHNVVLGFEMHPGDSVYNTSTMLRIREAVGDTMGCCFDPTHLFWQNIDPIKSILALGDAVVNVHAQDMAFNVKKIDLDGVLDYTNYEDYEDRAWHFKIPGYGHDEHFWKNMVSALRRVGFDGALNLEHQDPMMSYEEGFRKGREFLDRIIFSEPAGKIIY
jgi:sugar phosphate isomerase/epimerase